MAATAARRDVLEAITAAFNAHDPDAIMAFFADDAVYEPGDFIEECPLLLHVHG